MSMPRRKTSKPRGVKSRKYKAREETDERHTRLGPVAIVGDWADPGEGLGAAAHVTTDADSFVAAIRARPDDALPRLIFADWLDERGDPLGAFIRGQVELATVSRITLSEGDRFLREGVPDRNRERFNQLRGREKELLSQNADLAGRWLQVVR